MFLFADEYCDCADGSDEPGTSACANSRFYCRNVGAKGRILPSSRVNDGVCDCCDGSDENVAYSDVSCPNTCEEAGRSARESLARELATAEAGLVARQALLEKAKTSLDEKRQKLAHYEKVFAERKVLHEQAKAVKEAEEAEETAERDRRAFTKLREEAEAKRAAGGQDTATEQANVAVPIEDAAAPTETAQEQAAPVNEQPAAAAEEKENFPYPAEYAYNPDAAAAAAAPAAPAAEESFPYPAEYAYNPDAAQKATADTEESSADDSLTTSDAEEEQQQEQQEEEEEQEYVHPGQFSAHDIEHSTISSLFLLVPFRCHFLSLSCCAVAGLGWCRTFFILSALVAAVSFHVVQAALLPRPRRLTRTTTQKETKISISSKGT
jgi:protein kinase C substrate 80K-H